MKRILVLGAGGPAGVNFIRSLREAGGYRIHAWDSNPYHLGWPDADVRYLCPSDPDELLVRLRGYCDVHAIDLVHAQPDALVALLGANRRGVAAKTFLPEQAAIEICQDKLASLRAWEAAGLRSGAVELTDASSIVLAASTFRYPFWVRATEGAGGRGSTLVENREQLEGWLGYWRARGVPWRFIAEEYLPGRNLAWMSVWAHGELVTSAARERLEYIYPGAAPSGVTGTTAVSRSIAEAKVNKAAVGAVFAIDKRPHGVYCVDLKEDAEGRPAPTEINPGRFFTVSDFATALGANMPDLYCRLALGMETPELANFDATPPGYLWMRHIDCPAVLRAEEKVRAAAGAPA